MQKIKKIIIGAVFLTALVSFFNANITIVEAASVAELKLMIAELQEKIMVLQVKLGEAVKLEETWCHDFNVNLKIGDSGAEVSALEQALVGEGFPVTEHSSNFPAVFDEKMASSVVGFQEKYASEILAPWGLTHGTGYVGSKTREKLNELYGCAVEPFITVLSPNGGEKWTAAQTYNRSEERV